MAKPPHDIEITLLTGGQDRHYAFGLAMALASLGVCLDVIGSDEVDSPEFHKTPRLNFLNLRGNQRKNVALSKKISRVLAYYGRLISYAATSKPRLFHILWNNKFAVFDRTLLMLFYKGLGKKVVLTAHNVNAGRRDSADTLLNRLSLRVQYRLADRIFVHTEKMKKELLEDFAVRERAVALVPYGINNAVPDTDLSSTEAKQRLGIKDYQKTILFFGRIEAYKGVEFLLGAFEEIVKRHSDYHLIIAGESQQKSEMYFDRIRRLLSAHGSSAQITERIQFIPDQETELYFKAADVLVLPYKKIFQSGVLFLAYSFGLPVIATDVGSLREDIIEGETGFLCKPCDSVDLAETIEKYFDSGLFKELRRRRTDIRDYVSGRHSWDVVGKITRDVYTELLGGASAES